TSPTNSEETAMRFDNIKATLKTAVLVTTVLLLGAGLAVAQQVNLTAGSSNLTLPDGSVVPMWGYSCDDAGTGATCAALHLGVTWSPVVITVPYVSTGTTLNIKLTNHLPAPVAETSLMILGQLGGGLGNTATSTTSPAHDAQSITWPIAGGSGDPQNKPPSQANRVQSFSSPATNGNSVNLTWNNLKPGTYLIESGTHPSIQGPMGLYGMLVVTAAPADATTAGTAYPGVSYNADVD